MYTWILVTGALNSFIDACGIGANDLANSFGTTYGSKVLSVAQIIGLASVFEFAGAMVLGSPVTNTLAGSISNVTFFKSQPYVLMYGMLCALAGSSTWLYTATYLGLPVSTTHSIVGGIMGFSLVYKGVDGVVWLRSIPDFPYVAGFVPIVISWISSPIITAIISASIYSIVRYGIIKSEHAINRSINFLPIVVLFTVWIEFFFILSKGAGSKITWDIDTTIWVSYCIAFVSSILSIGFVPILHKKIAKYEPPETQIERKISVLPIDDRDAYPNKRIVTTGALLTHLFRQLFQKVSKDIRGKFVHEVNNDTWKRGDTPRPLEVLNVNNLYKILKVSTIEGKLKQALATGNFTVQGLGTSNSTALSNATKVGVSQVLNRLSYSATISHLRRIQTPIEKSGKLLAPRKLHGTSWGYVCPVETPEGHSVGIVKTITTMTAITQHTPSIVVIKLLKELDNIEWINSVTRKYKGTQITLNGVIIAYTTNPADINQKLLYAKQVFHLHPHSSVCWDTIQNNITIESDGGRFVRPLFRIVNGKLVDPPPKPFVWNDWVKTCIEFVDPLQSETIRVAMTPADITVNHTHCEIHPSLILGHMAASIPFSDHNQSPRNTYQSAMGKQSIGIFARNYAKRLDKNGYVLCSPMRPFVETRIHNILRSQDMPTGDNIIVAIGTYGGYNQEDSVILNRSSVDRGLFRCLYYTMYKDEEHRNITSGKEERFTKPSKDTTRGYKSSSKYAVQDNGIPILHTEIKENDVVIGKVTTIKSDPNGYAFRDSSTIHRNSESCRVDGVWQDKNSDGYPFIKVRVVSERVPEVGDKFSSRHGQKGTCGIILNEEDMPYTKNGLRPDLIMNPHAVPSRMTIAQLMETMFGKICTQRGTIGDGTPYTHLKQKELREHLLDL
jgi:DNA-directed RNA polymerase II subunit RPB2